MPKINVVPHRPGRCPGQVQGLIDDIVDMARQGKVQAIAFASVDARGDVTTGSAWGKTGQTITLQGAVTILSHHVYEQANVGRDVPEDCS